MTIQPARQTSVPAERQTLPNDQRTPTNDQSTVGERIRKVRAERGWTQDRLADQVGVSRSAVAQWETDRVGQVRGNLTRIAQALDVSVEFLLHGDDKRAPLAAGSGDELALLRLFRECDEEDRAFLLRTARKLARPPVGRAPTG